jgi:hypothetical protein
LFPAEIVAGSWHLISSQFHVLYFLLWPNLICVTVTGWTWGHLKQQVWMAVSWSGLCHMGGLFGVPELSQRTFEDAFDKSLPWHGGTHL